MRRVLVVGATSAIAEAVCRHYAAAGEALCLAARDAPHLHAIADDLRVRGAARVETITFDALDFDALPALVQAAVDTLGGIDVALVAHGSLPDQAACTRSPALTRREIDVNFTSAAVLLGLLATHLEHAKGGTLAVISSVAGDRGRASNYTYGAAKAGLDAFASGLRHRLHASGVRVVTIKPGFVDTPMTAAFAKGPLWASPQRVARGIVRAIDRGTPVAYVPGFWRPIMAAIRALPQAVFVRLKL